MTNQTVEPPPLPIELVGGYTGKLPIRVVIRAAKIASAGNLHLHQIADVAGCDQGLLKQAFAYFKIEAKEIEEAPSKPVDDHSETAYAPPSALTTDEAIAIAMPVIESSARHWYTTNHGFYNKIGIEESDMVSYLKDYVLFRRVIPTVRANPIHYLGFQCPDCGAQITPQDMVEKGQDIASLIVLGKVRGVANGLVSFDTGSGLIQCRFKRKKNGVGEYGGCGLIMPFCDWPIGKRGASLERSLRTACQRAMLSFHRYHYNGPRGTPYRNEGYHKRQLMEGDVDFGVIDRIVNIDQLEFDSHERELQVSPDLEHLTPITLSSIIDQCQHADCRNLMIVLSFGSKSMIVKLRKRLKMSSLQMSELFNRTSFYYQSLTNQGNYHMTASDREKYATIVNRLKSNGMITTAANDGPSLCDAPDATKDQLLKLINSLPPEKYGMAASLLKNDLGASEVHGWVNTPAKSSEMTASRKKMRQQFDSSLELEYAAISLVLGIEINNMMSPTSIRGVVTKAWNDLSDRSEIPTRVVNVIDLIINSDSGKPIPQEPKKPEEPKPRTAVSAIPRSIKRISRHVILKITRQGPCSVRVQRVGGSISHALAHVAEDPIWKEFVRIDKITHELVNRKKKQDAIVGGIAVFTSPEFVRYPDSVIKQRIAQAIGVVPPGPEKDLSATKKADGDERSPVIQIIAENGKEWSSTADIAKLLGKPVAPTFSTLDSLHRQMKLEKTKLDTGWHWKVA